MADLKELGRALYNVMDTIQQDWHCREIELAAEEKLSLMVGLKGAADEISLLLGRNKPVARSSEGPSRELMMEIPGPWAALPLAALFLWMALAPRGWTTLSNAMGRRGTPLGTRALGILGTLFCVAVWAALVLHDGGIRAPIIVRH